MQTRDNTAICLLLINKVPVMPEMAINSILATTTNRVYIGYLNPADIQSVPESNRISIVNLSNFELPDLSGTNGSNYVDFTKPDFYRIVQFKWLLLQQLSLKEYDTIIFTDFDVIWNQDPTEVINEAFRNFTEIDIQIQTYSSSPERERLCMGFVAFRNSINLSKDLNNLRELHSRQIRENPMVGDDDIISQYYHFDSGFRARVLTLPQSTFPTGNLINVFSRKNVFPGLIPYTPYIFHANFVVGSKKKILLMKTFQLNIQLPKVNIISPTGIRIFLSLLLRKVGVLVKRLFDKSS